MTRQRRPGVVALVVGTAAIAVTGLAGCGGGGAGRAAQSRDCLQGWDTTDNSANRARVAGLYTYARVVYSGGNCLFAFHGDDPPVLVLRGRWQGDHLVFERAAPSAALRPLPGGTPPSTNDNVVVNGRGFVRTAAFPSSTRIEASGASPHWLLLRARHDAWLYSDPDPIAVYVQRRGPLWRLKLQGDFLCEVCYKPRSRLKHYHFLVEEFNPRTKAAAAFAYTG